MIGRHKIGRLIEPGMVSPLVNDPDRPLQLARHGDAVLGQDGQAQEMIIWGMPWLISGSR